VRELDLHPVLKNSPFAGPHPGHPRRITPDVFRETGGALEQELIKQSAGQVLCLGFRRDKQEIGER